MVKDYGEREALLPGAGNYPPPLRKPRGPLLRTDDLTLIMGLPLLTFSISAIGVGMVPQAFRGLTYVIAVACFANAFAFIWLGRTRGQDRQGAAGATCIGLLCMVALGAGWTVGMYADYAYMDEYWRMNNGATYRGALASGADAAAYSDASVLEFQNYTFVDTERTLGYMEKGQVYCVAPVTGQAFSNSPLYYAVGMNCCDQRANFRCGQADPNALSAVVVRDSKSDAQFQTAIRVLESVYSLQPSGKKRIIVKFISDVGAYQADLWHAAFTSIVCASIVAAFLFIVAALLLRNLLKEAAATNSATAF